MFCGRARRTPPAHRRYRGPGHLRFPGHGNSPDRLHRRADPDTIPAGSDVVHPRRRGGGPAGSRNCHRNPGNRLDQPRQPLAGNRTGGRGLRHPVGGPRDAPFFHRDQRRRRQSGVGHRPAGGLRGVRVAGSFGADHPGAGRINHHHRCLRAAGRRGIYLHSWSRRTTADRRPPGNRTRTGPQLHSLDDPLLRVRRGWRQPRAVGGPEQYGRGAPAGGARVARMQRRVRDRRRR